MAIQGRIVVALLAILVLAVPEFRGTSASAASIAGDYFCQAFCRPSDAPPSVEIDGYVARCMSELGGIYTGIALTGRSVYCFKKTGVLSSDGKYIIWSDGAIWRRRSVSN